MFDKCLPIRYISFQEIDYFGHMLINQIECVSVNSDSVNNNLNIGKYHPIVDVKNLNKNNHNTLYIGNFYYLCSPIVSLLKRDVPNR